MPDRQQAFEPTAEIREMTATHAQLMSGWLSAGFSREEALSFLRAMIAAAASNGGEN